MFKRHENKLLYVTLFCAILLIYNMNDSSKAALKWLSAFVSKKKIVLLIMIRSFLSLSGILYALIYKEVLDQVAGGNTVSLINYVYLFVCLTLVQMLLNALFRRFEEIEIVEIENRLKKNLLSNLLYRDYAQISQVHSGEWMNRFSGDVSIIARHAMHIVPDVAGTLIRFVVSLIVLTFYMPKFTVLLILIGILALCFEVVFYSKIKMLHKKVQESDGFLKVFLQESLNSLAIIKSYSMQENALKEADMLLEEHKKTRLKKNLFSVLMNFVFGIGMNLLLLSSGVYCIVGIFRKEITYGTFLAVIQIVSQLRVAIAGAYVNIPNYYSMLGSIERVKEVENIEVDKKEEEKISDDFKRIEFRDLSFAYEKGKRNGVLEHLSLKIDKGDFVLISGPSGCGKSTLFKLLLALYKPDDGQMLIVNEREEILDSRFRGLFAYVPQDNQLLKGTIRDGICFGLPYDKERMRKALEIACCDEFIEELPKKDLSELREKGSGLSQGQMQRIAIARAVYSDRQILLLDEITSALDEKTEERIIDHLKGMEDKTIILVSHRRKIVDKCDLFIECEYKDDHYLWKVSKKKEFTKS